MRAASLPSALLDQAAEPYRAIGHVAWRFSRGKLQGDPAFAGLLQLGLIPRGARVLDLGCGRGLLAALLCSLTGQSAAERAWPAHWATAPTDVQVHGIDLLRSELELGRRALATLGARVRFTLADLRTAEFGLADVAVLLDVLHYMPFADQENVLRRVREALSPEGVLLLRVGDAAGGLRFRWSCWVDQVVAFMHTAKFPRLHCRTLGQWQGLLREVGFTVEVAPMHQGAAFANFLLVARRAPEPAQA